MLIKEALNRSTRNKKGNIKVFLLLAVLLVTGFYRYTKYESRDARANTNTGKAPTAEETKVVTIKESVYEYFYSSKKRGFAIQHPKDISISSSADGFVHFTKCVSADSPQNVQSNQESGNSGTSASCEGNGIYIKIKEMETRNGNALPETVQSHIDEKESVGESVGGYEEISLYGLSGYKYLVVTASGNTSTYYYFQNPENPKMYLLVIDLTADPDNLGYHKSAEKMIGTIVFKL